MAEEDPFNERLRRLEQRIAAARAAQEPPRSAHRGEFTQGSLAWRMVSELVVGMLLGLGIGYGLDTLFGTLPAFLVVFALVGFAAGVRTMLRTADEVKRKRADGAPLQTPEAGEGGDPGGSDGTRGGG